MFYLFISADVYLLFKSPASWLQMTLQGLQEEENVNSHLLCEAGAWRMCLSIQQIPTVLSNDKEHFNVLKLTNLLHDNG